MWIEAMAKHLPPSASALRLLDVGGACEAVLRGLRADLHITTASLQVGDWPPAPDSVDAITAFDHALTPEFLQACLSQLRAGGRLIIVNPMGQVSETWVKQLEAAHFVRILVEPALPDGRGVLIRGEKAHTTANTHERVQVAAQTDADQQTLATFTGRYVHVLVRQTPNKPAWRLSPDERLIWHACAVARGNQAHLLTFSSLPKAVAFLQLAVLQNAVHDVNKVAKFNRQTAQAWPHPVIVNPTLEDIQPYPQVWLPLDPATAETPDE